MNASTTIPNLPESVRPRERLWARGVDALSTPELLALVLRCGCPGESAVDLAASLLAEYRELSRLASARPEELAARRGVGVAKAAAVLAALRLGRLLDSETPAPFCRTAADLANLVRTHLSDLRHERTLVVVLDAGHRLRRIVTLTDGSVDRSLLPVREVLNATLRNDGRAFAVAHNHPSGELEPSAADLEATRALAAGAQAVGLRFLDHLIVAGSGWLSLRETGYLS